MEYKKYYKELYLHSLSLGFKSILKGFVNKESIKRILCPMDVSRYYELPAVIKSMTLKEGDKVLDISSPKLITSYLSNKYKNVNFWGIDKFTNEVDTWSNLVGVRKNLVLEYGDALKLKYPENYFDEIITISVIEHVGNGIDEKDGQMMDEIYRVLKKKGRLYLTTIISNNPDIIYKDKKLYSSVKKKISRYFFCRIYNYKQIRSRLIDKTKFKIIREQICNYRFPVFETIVNKMIPASAIFGFLNYLVAPINIRIQSIKKPIPNRAEYFCILEK